MENTKYKVIFHLDLDAFFCSVEELRYPFLKNKPFAIGDERKQRGIISTSNYKARKYQVKSAMSVQEAVRLCPHLILVNGDFTQYNYYSKGFFDILYTYTDNVLAASIDEGYMDVTDLVKNASEYYPLAQKIQREVHEKLGLTVSIGIAPNIFLAKMASEMEKPNGITVLRKRDFMDKIGEEDIREVYGLGKKGCEKLYKINIYKIKEILLKENEKKIIEVLGKNHYQDLVEKLQGNSSSILEYDKYSIAQSISCSHTFPKDLDDFELIIDEFQYPMQKVLRRMNKDHRKAKTISITIKYDDFKSMIRSKTLEFFTNQPAAIEHAVYELFEENWNEKKVRLVGVGVSNFEDESNEEIVQEKEEINLFNYLNYEEKRDYVKNIIKKINENYDHEILFQGKSTNSEEKK